MSDMTLLSVLSCNLIFIVAMAVSNDDFDLPVPLMTHILPRHYDIKFMLYVNDDIFYGECNVSIYIPYEMPYIYIYNENLGITGITVTENIQISKGNEKKVSAHRPKKLIYDETYGTRIFFPYNLPRGYHTLNMKFIGLLAENGGFRTFYINQQYNRVWLTATHYQPFATRRLFPLLKDTRYASYNIAIKHHKNYTVLSNMPERAVNINKNNMIWTHFETSPVMPDYFIAASVVPRFLIRIGDVQLWCRMKSTDPRDMKPIIFAYKVILNITQLLKDIFPYIRKTPQTNHIVIPKLLDVEEIKLGHILYNEADIIFDNQIDVEIRKFEIIRIIGHKMVYELFFYNAIFPCDWDLCLRKSFATFLGINVADKNFPHFEIQDYFVVQMQYDVLHWSTKDTWPLKSQLNNSFELPCNIKVSIMLHTLQNTLTKEKFEIGINIYLQNQYTGINDFWKVMQLILDRTSFEMRHYNIQYKISSWAELNHYPVINVKRYYDTFRVNISVENFNTNIWIPISIITETYLVLGKIVHPVWLTPPHISQHLLTFDSLIKDDWILVDSQKSGYYRVNYDAENWKRLSTCLNNIYLFRQIHVLNRAKIIDDTFHFMMSGQLNRTQYLNILQYLRQDTDYIAWYPMFKNLEYISIFFAYPESTLIKAKISQPLIEIMENIVYPVFKADKINQNIDLKKAYMREEIARWLCIMNDTTCLTNANYKLMSYVLNDDNYSLNKIWTGWKEWLFCNGLKTANENVWRKVFRMYWVESDYSLLKFLACSKNSVMIREYMYVMRFNVITQRAKVLRHVQSFCSIIARHAKDNIMLDFILRNLEDIKPEEISNITALTIIINHVYSKEQIKKINMEIDFWDNLQSLIYCNSIYQIIDEINNCLSLKAKYKENIIIYLKRKLELRWNQIKIQLYEFRYLADNLEDILTQSWDD